MFSEGITHAHINVLAYDDSDSFHWLRAPERIQFTPTVLVYCALYGCAPTYLILARVADLSSKSRLLPVNLLSRLTTVGEVICWPSALRQSA